MQKRHRRRSRYSPLSPLCLTPSLSLSLPFFRSLCSTAQKYMWIDESRSENGRQTRRDVRQMRSGCGMDGGGSARGARGGARRKFIKLRSSCPEPSRSNWKNLVFRLSTWRGYRTGGGYLLVIYLPATLNPALRRLFCSARASLTALSQIKQYLQGKATINDGIAAITTQSR